MIFVALLLSLVHAQPGDLLNLEAKEPIGSSELTKRLSVACPGTESRLGSGGLRVFALTYETTDVEGRPTPASGALYLPEGGRLDVVSYQHGTTIERKYAPSLNDRRSEARMEGACYGSQGFAVVIADYLGYGASTTFHPYIHADTEATAAADALRAARVAAARLNVALDQKLFLAGYSQGGHATMALHRYLQFNRAAEFPVTASAPMAGPYEPAETVRIALRKPDFPTTAEGGFLVVAYAQIYGLSLAEMVAPPFLERVTTYFPGEQSFEEVISNLPADPRDLFVPRFLADLLESANNAFYRALQMNDVYDWKPDAPVLFIHGTADLQVPPFNASLADTTMRRLGADTRVIWIEGKGHGEAATEATTRAIAWFNERRTQ